MKKNIKAILFDSGKVLNYPTTGHWFITPEYFSFVDKKKFNAIDKEKIDLAFDKACAYVNGINLIKTKDEEYFHFKRFYELFSESLPELELKEEEIDGLTKDIVYNPDKYTFYEDALKVLPELRKKYRLAIVSDAWPSLRDVYEDKGLFDFFESFVISSIIGVTKPDEKMYLTAIEELNIEPGEAVFIDDHLKNCLGAINLGINAVYLCRDKAQYLYEKKLSKGKGYEVINNLEELKDIIE